MDGNILVNYYNVTTLHPLALIALIIAGAAMAVTPRRYALAPMLALACAIAPAQRIVFATLDFNFLRMMIIMGWVRVLLHGEWRGFRWRLLDSIVLLWGVSATLVPIFQHGTSDMIINRLGYLYDGAGLYFLVRMLVRDWDDVLAFARVAAVLAVPVMGAFLVEKATGRNFFAVFGGVTEHTVERAGRLRCRGAFTHPILAGAFWCSLLPIIVALWWHRGWNRPLAIIGTACALVIVWSTSSATSTNGMIVAGIAMAAFATRRYLGWTRWLVAIGLLVTHFAMNGPIWALLTRMNTISGATGWYRYKLFDDFFRHFFDWWLLGTTDFTGWWWSGRFAITSEYVLHGVRGGLATLALFVAIILVGFHGVGRMLRDNARQRLHLRPRPAIAQPPPRFPSCWNTRSRSIMAWALGASLFTHAAIFVGVAYFAQAILMWYVTVGMIGSLSPRRRRRALPVVRLRSILPRSTAPKPA